MSATTMCHLTKFAIAALSSDAKCAESVSIATEPEKQPPISCATMKKQDTTAARHNYFSADSYLVAISIN